MTPIPFTSLPLHPPDDAFFVPVRTDVVTPSRLASYLHCPQQYHLIMNQSVPWDFIPPEFLIQETVHDTISAFYQSIKAGKVMKVVALMETYGKCWNGIVPESDIEAEHLKRVGQTLIEAFEREIHVGKIIGVGEKVQAPLVNFRTGESLGDLSGVIEVTEVDKDGFLTVRYTSVSDKYTDSDDLELRLALMGCSYLVRSAWDLGEGSIKLQCDQLVYSPAPQICSREVIINSNDELEYTRMAGGILRSIDEAIFTPKPGADCLTCPVKSSCSVY